MIAIIDYGMGNLRSVQKGFEKVGHEAIVTRDAAEVQKASKVVLPGVGAMEDAIAELKRLGLIDSILESIDSGKPFLGICLGLQLLPSQPGFVSKKTPDCQLPSVLSHLKGSSFSFDTIFSLLTTGFSFPSIPCAILSASNFSARERTSPLRVIAPSSAVISMQSISKASAA